MQVRQDVTAAPTALGALIIRLEGEFDLAERDRLTDAFAIAQSAPVVIVDFGRASYIDSTVLQCLMTLYQACEKRGAQFVLVGVRPTVRRLFEITQLDKVLDIRSSLNEVAFDATQVRRLTIESRPIAD